MAFTRKTLVRQISRPELLKIAEILNENFAWRTLMQTVPLELTDEELLNEDKPKYTFYHVKLVENAAVSLKKPAAQIFLEEWITSGRIQPTLSHLLELLIKSVLFRAADYVAVNLLSEAPPQRPSTGPAAKVDISLPQNDDTNIIEEMLNGNYPHSSEILNLNKGSALSKNIPNKQILGKADATRSYFELKRNNKAKPSTSAETSGRNSPSTNSSYLPDFADILSSSMVQNTTNAQSQDIKPTSPATGNNPQKCVQQVHPSQINYFSESSQDFLPRVSLLKIGTPQNETVQLPDVSLLNLSDSLKQATQNSEQLPDVSLLNLTETHSQGAQSTAQDPDVSLLNLRDTVTQATQNPGKEQDSSEYIPNVSGLIM